MYTHAISWAIQGKKAAQAARKKKGGVPHFADLIDKAVREGQEKQSIGIPIGPDTSMVLAELILSRVDERLATRIKSLAGVRITDDYELYFENAAQAEQARIYLAQALAEYRLMLNPRKTKVVELPVPLEPSWKHTLSGRAFGGSAAASRKAIRSAGDAAFAQRHADPESRAITYFLAVLSGCRYHPDAWPLAQSMALASLEHEENSLPKAAKLMLTAQAKGWQIDKASLSAVLNRIILRHAPLDYGNSVCWALWLMMRLSLSVDDDAADAAAKMEDPFVLTLLADAKKQKLVRTFAVSTLAKALHLADAWEGASWLFLYECVRHGWLGARTHAMIEGTLKRTPYLSSLNKRGVTFYDPLRLPALATGRSATHPAFTDAHAWATIELTNEY